MDIKGRIIEYIRENRVSTTEVADCLGKTGVLPDVMPINQGQFRVGNVKWVYTYGESNYYIHEQIRDIEKGNVVFMEAFDCGDRALVGELVSKFLILYRQSVSIITNGKMRDAHNLIKEKYPIWCKGVTPIGCFNTPCEKDIEKKIIDEHREMYDGAIAVCDDSGVVIIPKEQITEDFLQKLVNIETQEDIWFDCIDRLKWDTFDTVCKKKYLEKNND